MALQFTAKAPEDTKRYTWEVPVVSGDSVTSYSVVSSSGITVDSSGRDGNDIVLYLSGGTASTTGNLVIHAATTNGEDFYETFYIPILPAYAAEAHSETAQSIIQFALRPVTGIVGTATSDELADGLEWLNAMLAMWRATGADVGAVLPLALATRIYAKDEWLMAIKANLRVFVAEQYGREISQATAMMAKVGLQTVKNDMDLDPAKAEYY